MLDRIATVRRVRRPELGRGEDLTREPWKPLPFTTGWGSYAPAYGVYADGAVTWNSGNADEADYMSLEGVAYDVQ